MKKFLLTALFAASTAFAQTTQLSPAETLFEQAGKYVIDNFDGAIAEPLETTVGRFRDELKAVCASDGINCPYVKGSFSIQNLIRSLNERHTGFISAERMESLRRQSEGAGATVPELGIYSARIRGSTDRVVIEVKLGSPALEAGVRIADRITQINGKNLPAGLSDSSNAIAQAESSGNPISLTIRRRNEGTLTLTIQPKPLTSAELPTLRLLENTNPKAAVLRIPTFTGLGLVAKRVFELVRAAESQSVAQIIVDLRGNPGGSAYECPTAASAFTSDVVTTYKGRAVNFQIGFDLGKAFFKPDNKEPEIAYTIENPRKWAGKMAVLVNNSSASCSEYFSDHIQATKRGAIVGELTTGVSNTVVYRYTLLDGTGVQMAVAKAFRRDGSAIPFQVTPDIDASWNYGLLADEGRDNMIETALETMK